MSDTLPAPLIDLEGLGERAAAFARASRSPATRRAYKSDWTHFCGLGDLHRTRDAACGAGDRRDVSGGPCWPAARHTGRGKGLTGRRMRLLELVDLADMLGRVRELETDARSYLMQNRTH